MPITILQPVPLPIARPHADYASGSDSDSAGGADIEGDISMMRSSKRPRWAGDSSIVTPGEVITEDPQWMRYVSLSLSLFLTPLSPLSRTQIAK